MLYEENGSSVSILFEESARSEGAWIALSDQFNWQTGKAISDPQRKDLFARLNDWGSKRGWSFKEGIKLSEVLLGDVPAKRREIVRALQDAARRQEALRGNVKKDE